MATWGPIQLRLKGSRQVEFDGEASPAPGGGSIPQGVLSSAEFLCSEQTEAGTFVGTLPILAGSVVLDVFVYVTSEWDALDSVTVGDTAQPTGYFNGPSPSPGPYDPTAPVQDNGMLTIGSSFGGNYGTAAYSNLRGAASTNAPAPGVRYATDDTITVTVHANAPGGPPSGELVVKIIYFAPVDSGAVAFTPDP